MIAVAEEEEEGEFQISRKERDHFYLLATVFSHIFFLPFSLHSSLDTEVEEEGEFSIIEEGSERAIFVVGALMSKTSRRS